MAAWTFVHVTDIHIGSPRSYRFAPRYNDNWKTAAGQIVDEKPELLLVGGDLTRDGNTHDYELDQAKSELDGLGIGYHTIPGNVELGNKCVKVQGARDDRDDIADNMTSHQFRRFAEWFGSFPWTFVQNNVRFSGFIAAVAGSGLPEEIRMWQWLEDLAELPRPQFHVVVTHWPLFLDDPNEPNYDHTIADQYVKWYGNIDQPYRRRILEAYKAAGVDVVLSGHLHNRRTDAVEGIQFMKAAATAKPQWRNYWSQSDPTLGFYRFDVTDKAVTPTFIPLARVSTATGYGPSGHPLPGARDYSLAREPSS